MERRPCKCGRGMMSAYDGKCGHCRNNRERKIHARLIAGVDAEKAMLGYHARPPRPGPATADDFRD